jgi:hypothetical protein
VSGWSWGGIALAGLALIAFEVVVSSSEATGTLSLLQVPGQLAASWLNPAAPLVPDKAAGTVQSSVNVGASTQAGVQQSLSQLSKTT